MHLMKVNYEQRYHRLRDLLWTIPQPPEAANRLLGHRPRQILLNTLFFLILHNWSVCTCTCWSTLKGKLKNYITPKYRWAKYWLSWYLTTTPVQTLCSVDLLRAHSPSVQFLLSIMLPLQCFPPFLGGGAWHSRLRQWVHSVPQADHLAHSVQPPSTGMRKQRRVILQLTKS